MTIKIKGPGKRQVDQGIKSNPPKIRVSPLRHNGTKKRKPIPSLRRRKDTKSEEVKIDIPQFLMRKNEPKKDEETFIMPKVVFTDRELLPIGPPKPASNRCDNGKPFKLPGIDKMEMFADVYYDHPHALIDKARSTFVPETKDTEPTKRGNPRVLINRKILKPYHFSSLETGNKPTKNIETYIKPISHLRKGIEQLTI